MLEVIEIFYWKQVLTIFHLSNRRMFRKGRVMNMFKFHQLLNSNKHLSQWFLLSLINLESWTPCYPTTTSQNKAYSWLPTRPLGILRDLLNLWGVEFARCCPSFFLVRINNNLFNEQNWSLDASLTTWYSESSMMIIVREYKFSGNIFYCMYYLRPLCTASRCFSFIHYALNFIGLGSTVFSAISSGTGYNIIWGPSWSKLFVFISSSFSILCECPSITSKKFNLYPASGQEKRLLRFKDYSEKWTSNGRSFGQKENLHSVKVELQITFNPSTPMSDQDRISPYNINTISSRQVMRIKKNIN